MCSCVVYYHVKYTKKTNEVYDLKYERDSLNSKYTQLCESVKEIKESVEEEMEQWKKEVEEKSSEELRMATEKMASEYDEALKEEMENLTIEVEKIDKDLGERYKEMMAKNTLLFTCVCDKSKKIACPIDLSSDENYFHCENCGANYRVEISAYPVLLSNVSSNQTLASMYD